MNHNGKRPVILILEPEDFPPEAASILGTLGTVVKGPYDRHELLEAVESIDVIIVRLGHAIDRELIDHAPNLTVIVTSTTGLNHIDLAQAESRNIEVLSLKGETEFLNEIAPTAELTFGLILSLVRHIPAAAAHAASGQWDRNLYKGYDLRGRRLGIYGCGRIGRKVARMGVAFEMKVIAYDIEPQAIEGVEFVTEDKLLAESDIVSLHVPYSSDLHEFFDADYFAKMKQGSYFINTSRGELVNETDLHVALQSKISAGLDVLNGEYSPDKSWSQSHPLLQYAGMHNNLIITPHIGGASYDSMARVENFMAKKLAAFLAAR